jgi:NDP-sugar pyrophosphorylase family protein
VKAIMLAAGQGTRCIPFSYLSPKICQQVAGIPVLEFMLSWFSGTLEVDKLYIALRDDSHIEHIRLYIQKRKQYLNEIIGLFERIGYKVDYSNPDIESEIVKAKGWGTGGDLKLAVKQVVSAGAPGGDFLVCNADYIIARKLPGRGVTPQLNLTDIINYHRNCRDELGAVITVSVVGVNRREAARCGVAITEAVGNCHVIRRFMEKPDVKDIPETPLINAGVYVFDSDFFVNNMDRYLPDGPDVNLERMMLERMAEQDKPMMAAYPLELVRWFDVGTLEQLVDANIYIASKEGIE